MISRFLMRLTDAQARWARPLGDRGQGLLRPLFQRAGGITDVLNGTWLGHPVHPLLVALPIGMLTLMVVLDIAGQDVAADVALTLSLLALLAAAVTGSADAVDLHGHTRTVTTVHAATMMLATLLLLLSLVLRTASGDDRGLAVVLGFVGYLVLALGAWIGGEVAYTLGSGVNRNAWRRALGRDWQALGIDGGDDLPEDEPVRTTAAGQALVLVREGETVRALLDTCAHAGGPLSKGTVRDGCLECPWHASRFDLRDGRVRAGPSVYDQPAFEVRHAEAGGYEVRERMRRPR